MPEIDSLTLSSSDVAVSWLIVPVIWTKTNENSLDLPFRDLLSMNLIEQLVLAG